MTNTLSPKLLTYLICPITHKPLTYNKKKKELTSTAAKMAYPIKNGLPVLVPSEARPLTEKEITS
ncbi:MAG: Trm112 family protein [Alphaproteobacteria bacterium]|nr:Trm112 family protein [Alphaproteobacteria bacterium]MDD9920352.1 Trm112 family protein [Alphaproteobacteria bacterium]